MNTCEGCGLDLKHGSVHVNPESCIRALRHALEDAKTCAECKEIVETVVHPGCVHKLVGKRAVDLGLDALQKRAKEKLTDFFAGKNQEQSSEDPGEDAPPRGGKRWKGR
jgi:hypothetical protein